MPQNTQKLDTFQGHGVFFPPSTLFPQKSVIVHKKRKNIQKEGEVCVGRFNLATEVLQWNQIKNDFPFLFFFLLGSNHFSQKKNVQALTLHNILTTKREVFKSWDSGTLGRCAGVLLHHRWMAQVRNGGLAAKPVSKPSGMTLGLIVFIFLPVVLPVPQKHQPPYRAQQHLAELPVFPWVKQCFQKKRIYMGEMRNKCYNQTGIGFCQVQHEQAQR